MGKPRFTGSNLDQTARELVLASRFSNIRDINEDYTIQDSDSCIRCDTSINDVTLSLPRAENVPGKILFIVNTGDNVVNFIDTTGEPLSLSVPAGATLNIRSVSSEWLQG